MDDTTASRRSVPGGRRRTGSGSPARLPGEIPGRLTEDVPLLLQFPHPPAQLKVLVFDRTRPLRRRDRRRPPGRATPRIVSRFTPRSSAICAIVVPGKFFVDGVTQGDLARALKAHISEDLAEHSPGIGDGVDGLAAAYGRLVDRYERRFVHPIRGFEGGDTVVIHSLQTFGYREVDRVCMDIVDIDADDMITAHWSVSTPVTPIPGCGHSQIDGPTHVTDLHATVATKQLITAYTAEILIRGRAHRSGRFLSTARVTHDPGIDADGAAIRYLRIVRVAGCGNFGVVLSTVAVDGRAGMACDLYRTDNGVIVEHWRTVEVTTMHHNVPSPVPITVARHVTRNTYLCRHGPIARHDAPRPSRHGTHHAR